ncbi:MAG: CHAD domain-containing protein [Phycisphaerales bacterium]|nr:CHAD domain-containing protein [Phycisphaerales bacterium]
MITKEAEGRPEGAAPGEPERGRSEAGPSPDPGGGDAVARFVHSAILRRWRGLSESVPAALDSDAEAIHNLRVSSRRLRAVLTVFGGYLRTGRAKRVGKALRKVTRGAGGAREWDVHGEALARQHAASTREGERAAIEHMLELVDARRAHEHARMARRLAKIDFGRLGRDVRWLAEHLVSAAAGPALPEAAWGVLEPLLRDAFCGMPRLRERERADEMHALRIAVKRLRYAIELLEPAFADGHARLLARCKQLQDVLGRHHDLVMLDELLSRTLSRLSEHGRGTLADGLLPPLERLRGERREQYLEFCGVTTLLDDESFADEVRRGLRMPRRIGASESGERETGARS